MADLSSLKKCFEVAKETNQKFICILVEMKGFQKPELIVTESEDFDSKLAYYEKSYNEDLTLKSCKDIKIVGHAFGDDLNYIDDYLKNNKLARV